MFLVEHPRFFNVINLFTPTQKTFLGDGMDFALFLPRQTA